MDKISPEELRRILDYNPDTGEFTWLVAPAYWKKAGTPAGCVRRDGYCFIGWRKKLYSASHVAWAWMTGAWPLQELDHIDRNPSNNRWANLREANSAQNKNNRAVRKDSGTGVKGVQKHHGNRFRAKIRHEGKHYHLGLFHSIEEAEAAYAEAAARLHGGFNPAGLTQGGESS